MSNENKKYEPILLGEEGKTKQRCEALYKIISDAEKELKEIRENCKHENTYEGLYELRVGATLPAIICKDCGSVVKNLSFGKMILK